MTDVIGGERIGSDILIRGGAVHLRMFLEAAFAEVDRSRGIVNGVHERLFLDEALPASVRHDQEVSAAETLGLDDVDILGGRFHSNHLTTRNGQVVE